MKRYVDLPTLAASLCLSEQDAELWVTNGILPQPTTRGGKRVWQWSKVEKAMSDDEGEFSKVYFTESQGFIKIGFTRDLGRRVFELSSTLPCPIVVLHVMTGSFDLETDLHRKFAHLRTRGEWFRRGEDLLEYIDQMKNGKIDKSKRIAS